MLLYAWLAQAFLFNSIFFNGGWFEATINKKFLGKAERVIKCPTEPSSYSARY